MARMISIRDRALQAGEAIALLSDKWRIPILHILRDGPLRTNQIQSAISAVSPKVLTQTLRGLERDGLIVREIFHVVPPRVEYSLSAMGRSLLKPLADLCHWAQAHVKERDAARIKFDVGSSNKPKPTAAARKEQNASKTHRLPL